MLDTLLVTGITGSLGRAVIANSRWPGRIRGLSRDEQKQDKMRPLAEQLGLQLVLGDVRDLNKCRMVTRNVAAVIHTAALKIIPNSAYNPDEVIRTNALGTENVLRAAIENKVPKVIVVSTDKACWPSTLYGATKLCQEALAVEMNGWSPDTNISVVRYGNVKNSRGSFTHQLENPDSVLKITDPECTRFWIELEDAVAFIVDCMDKMIGGEIFVPRMRSKRLGDMIPPGAQFEVVGLRKTEKLHEWCVAPHELPHTDVTPYSFVVRPWPHQGTLGEATPYASNSPEEWGSENRNPDRES